MGKGEGSKVGESESSTEEKVRALVPSVEMGQDYIYKLSVLATGGLAVMWLGFWAAVVIRGENISNILLSAGFFRTVTVMGVVAATVVLCLAGRLEGNITGAILTGIVGYVLGRLSGRGSAEEKPTLTR